ncbi:nuclear transport factor 2 family protein [Gramella sp. GC03-9]|uniref:Nuclear transport factor 2 family protein n=1 Tax=Christiangramia oceanisediminis TaxID=2920386 RepID=A0A9X2KUX4_9FLAO|nr:nuclear transport factor 2 family protein [Gramella oceanisediminis]MCP9198597.1 nuclear transport factor 2 family protein [Gramella oceanisediminis]
MKRFIVILLLVAIPQFVQSQDEQAKKELTRLLDDFLEGAGKNDLEIHDRFWAEDLIYTSSSGERFGKEQLMNGVRNAEEDSGNSMVWSAEDVQINIYDDTAIVAFRLVGEAYAGEKNTYLNSGTFVKRNGQWEAVNWQATKERAK